MFFLENGSRGRAPLAGVRFPADNWARTIVDAPNPESDLRPETDREQGLNRGARRNLLLLACCQAVGQSCNTMMFAATGLSIITR
jgi:hypothetical protein